ncbi:hypothetical protein [Streptomyces sp. NPDC005533]|uniref:hypothetical protein n=1 Tax=Streptomyces sp. NPDC005533 TaxID=3364723 RepID=UPI0036739C60
MSITSRRLAPLLIATTIATAGLALTTTAANAAPAPTTASVTTDSNNPLLDAFGKSGKTGKIGDKTANGGDTQPPASGTQPQPPSNDDTKPPTGGAGGSSTGQRSDGILVGGGGGSGGDAHKNDGDPNADGLDIVIYDHSPLGGHYPSESRTDDARPGPIFRKFFH